MSLLQSSNSDLFESPDWGAIWKELDQVPIFVCTNTEGQLLNYEVELGKKGEDGKTSFEVPQFYTHVEDALRVGKCM